MMKTKWLTAKDVAARYGVGSKWPWTKQKTDPTFPRGVRFGNGMTRWSEEQLDCYDQQLINEQQQK